MKKTILLAAMSLLVLAACNEKREKDNSSDSLKSNDLEAKYQEASNFNDSLLILVSDIYTGLDSINMQEGLLFTPGIGDNTDRRAEIRENLSVIRQRLAENRAMLEDMEKRAAAAGADTKVFKRTIEEMKKRIETQELKIQELSAQLELANQTIEDLSNQVADTQEQLDNETMAHEETQAQLVATENEANTVYYIIGSNKVLKENKVLEKKFLGATKIMQGDDINYSAFVKGDKRNLEVIPVNAKDFEVKSSNDPNSYRKEGEKGNMRLVITNKALFWQKSPYLIIETK